MNSNDFDLEAFFDCYAFDFDVSAELKESIDNFSELLKSKFNDFKLCSEIEDASSNCCAAAEKSAFKEGFCFAVKLMKALNRI